MTTQISPDRPRSNRRFASMDLSKQREIASKGGKAAHAQGRAHEFVSPDLGVERWLGLDRLLALCAGSP